MNPYQYAFTRKRRGPFDFDGNPVKRTRDEYPYSYDPYVTHRNGKKDEVTHTVYSDRLFQWDSEKYNKCCTEVWKNQGQDFEQRSPGSIEKLLQLYTDDPTLRLIGIMQGANVSSGYPYWIFLYNSTK